MKAAATDVWAKRPPPFVVLDLRIQLPQSNTFEKYNARFTNPIPS